MIYDIIRNDRLHKTNYMKQTASKRSGRNVPSVSMYRHFPSPPPWLMGNWHVTANVWHNCVLPVRNSPNISVIEPVSRPPPSNLSNSREPDVRNTISARLWWKSVADRKPIGTYLPASSSNLSTLPSEKPFISLKCKDQQEINFNSVKFWCSNIPCMLRHVVACS